jgi:hypothetical protein
VLVQLKRQRLRAVQDLEFLCQQLDLAGFQIDVGRARGPQTYHTRDLEHVLVAHALRLREHLRPVRIEYHLQQPLAVAQVDENDAAVVTPPVGPTGHGDHRANRGFAHLSAIMSAHKLLNCKRESARC